MVDIGTPGLPPEEFVEVANRGPTRAKDQYFVRVVDHVVPSNVDSRGVGQVIGEFGGRECKLNDLLSVHPLDERRRQRASFHAGVPKVRLEPAVKFDVLPTHEFHFGGFVV